LLPPMLMMYSCSGFHLSISTDLPRRIKDGTGTPSVDHGHTHAPYERYMDTHLPVMPGAVKADEDPEGCRRPRRVALITIEAHLRARRQCTGTASRRFPKDHPTWQAPTLFSLRRDMVRSTAGQSFVWSGRLAS
jgi:hypothetical protein